MEVLHLSSSTKTKGEYVRTNISRDVQLWYRTRSNNNSKGLIGLFGIGNSSLFTRTKGLPFLRFVLFLLFFFSINLELWYVFNIHILVENFKLYKTHLKLNLFN